MLRTMKYYATVFIVTGVPGVPQVQPAIAVGKTTCLWTEGCHRGLEHLTGPQKYVKLGGAGVKVKF